MLDMKGEHKNRIFL